MSDVRTTPPFRELLARFKAHERAFLVTAALLVGVLGGYGAVGFRALIALVQRLWWGSYVIDVERIASHPWFWILLVPVLGGAVVGPLVWFLAREARGHGVPEVMEAVALKNGVIRPRVVAVKSLASALSIGCGGSVGREGPIVQIGSALASTIGQKLRVSGDRLRTLVGCGAAAGIAATFNAPVAGALFAVEVILADFRIAKFSPIVISSVAATVVARHHLGDVPAFLVPHYGLGSPLELPLYFLLGVAAGLLAWLFVKLLYGLEDLVERGPIPQWLVTSLGAVGIGALGLVAPHVFGVGYDTIEAALRADLALGLLAGLVVAKLLATCWTLAIGFSGGIFAPSLFMGAMLGGAFGMLAQLLFPTLVTQPGAYALVGMGAVVAAATRAPITAIMILFELTNDYEIILPLMASCIVATLLYEKLERESIYTMKLARRGVQLRGGTEQNVLRGIRVADAFSRDVVTLPENATLGRIVAKMNDAPRRHYYVVDGEGRLVGVLDAQDLAAHLPDARVLANLLTAAELAREDVPRTTPDEDLAGVSRILDRREREELPVVDPESGRLLGTIGRHDLLRSYNRELVKRDVAHEFGASLETATRTHQPVRLGNGFRMLEIEVPPDCVGRTLRDLDLRRRCGVQVLVIEREGPDGERKEIVAGGDTALEAGDRLVCMGREEDLERLARGAWRV